MEFEKDNTGAIFGSTCLMKITLPQMLSDYCYEEFKASLFSVMDGQGKSFTSVGLTVSIIH